MSRYIPPEEMSEAQIREQLDAEYKHWDDLKKNGCSDPAWPDGVNLNLVRNHIIYWYRLLRERTSQTVQLSMFDAGMDLRNERPLPPELPESAEESSFSVEGALTLGLLPEDSSFSGFSARSFASSASSMTSYA